MGGVKSSQNRTQKNSANEHVNRSSRRSDKHEAPKQTTSESTEVETTVGMKNQTQGTDISNGPSNQRGRSIEIPKDKQSQTSANSGGQGNASGDKDFTRLTSKGQEEQNEDGKKKPQKTMEEKRNYAVSYTTETNENHATDSENDREKIHEYERKIERLEADIIKLTQEKGQLLNGRDEVSYKTNSAEIHATDLTKDRNKYDEYKTKVESLEADVMKLRMENETLLKRLTSKGQEEQNKDGKKKPQKTMEEKRRNDVSNTTNNSDEKHATDLTNDRNKLHEYERKVGCLEADVIKLREEKNKLLNRPNDVKRTDDKRTPSSSQEENSVKPVNRNGEVSYTTTKKENQVITDETKKMQEYEREVKRLEAEVIKLTQEKNQLLNRQAPGVLEQKKNEDRETKLRNTKENERNDEVSYTTGTNKSQAKDSANNRKKINEYEKIVESLEVDIIKLTQERDKLLKRPDDLSYTTIADGIHATNSANNSKEVDEYKRKVERLEAEIIKVTQENNQLLNRNHEVSYTTKTNENHATDSANDREKIHEYERKIERLEADIIKLTQEKSQLLNGRDEVSYKTNSAEIHATDLTKDRNKYDEYKTKVESLEADVMKLRMENETLLKRLTSKGPEEQNEDGKKKPPKTMEKKRRNDVSNKTNNSDEKHATDLTNDGNKLHEYERKVGCLEADVIKLREEKNKLLNRLSEIGAIKLTGNNHKVTDLSDEDRPEKVAEQFSELYDTEWTDAYENLTKIQCKQADWSVKQLLDVLKETYIMCVSSTQEKMKDLKKAISNFLGLTEREATDFDLMETRKRIQEHRKKMLQRNISNIGKEVRAQLKTKLDKEIYECLSDYIEKCVIICWNMCTKEPPMYLDFGDCKQAAHAGDEKAVNMPFDKLKFVTYTKSGDYVDYIVWPAVYIYEGGPLMKKGVAQGSKLITNTMDVMEN